MPFTEKLDSLGQFNISSVTEQRLRDDMVKVLESAVGTQFTTTDYIAVCSATNNVVITTNGTATATATADLTAKNVRSIVDFMRKKHIPKYDGSNYVAVASISSVSGLHDDTGAGGWQDLVKYTEGNVNKALNGEVGVYYMTRFVEETGFLSNTIGSGSTRGQALFFGSDTVYEAVATPEEIRVKIPADYGRDQGLAWYALLGFKIVWSFSADAEQHIVFVTSA